MSLGWQTESALLPSKATPIHVDGKSMIGLKAAVYEQEQQLINRGKKSVSELRERRSQMTHSKSPHETKDKNSGVNARAEKDEEAYSEEQKSADKVLSALQAKAALYEKIKSGAAVVDTSSCLIDFSRQKRAREEEKNQENKLIDIKEELVNSGSIKTPSSSQTAQVSVVGGNNEKSYYGPVSDSKPSWNWSKGNRDVDETRLAREEPSTVEEYKRLKTSETSFMKRVKEELAASSSSRGLSSNDTVTISAGARVKSQWEKTLKGSSKVLLEQIHAETQHGRSATEEPYDSADTLIDGYTADESKLSSRDQRLLLIKRKQEELRLRKNSASMTS